MVIMNTFFRDFLYYRVREGNKREGGRVGLDSLVKQDAVHGSCEV